MQKYIRNSTVSIGEIFVCVKDFLPFHAPEVALKDVGKVPNHFPKSCKIESCLRMSVLPAFALYLFVLLVFPYLYRCKESSILTVFLR